MGFHTFDAARADRLEDPTRFRFCSREELLQYLPGGTVLDIGSGTGYYTDEIAPAVERVIGLDIQPAMHEQYRDRGVPANVRLVVGDAEQLPFADGTVDGALSTMTFHESTTPQAVADLHRVLGAGAPLVVVDWSSEGNGESGPPLSERFDARQAREFVADAGLRVESAAERSETFHLVARAPEP
jgi:ubiquinone/menaquinone biosynthesis C-methylase UbiE